MYSYHAWIVLKESAMEIDEGGLDDKKRELQTLVHDKLSVVPEASVGVVNCLSVLQCTGSRNHRGDSHDRLLSVLRWIVGELPGSHGLVYWIDDEIPGRHVFDGYNVIVVAEGRIQHRYDPFLSPLPPET